MIQLREHTIANIRFAKRVASKLMDPATVRCASALDMAVINDS